MSKELRTNDKIKAREVRLVDDNGAQLGVLRLEEALELAQEKNLDLVEVAPTANPPVCKLLDFGRFKYEQTKREREARKGQKQLVLKEIWFRPNVDDHDRNFKTKQIQRFLEEGDKVKVTVRYRGRELAHPELGRTVLNRVATDLENLASIEKPATMEGRAMTMIVAPGKALQKLHQQQHPVASGARPVDAATGTAASATSTAPSEQPVPVSQPVRTPQPVA
ncbi:MAG: translation initiation factor IF-3 [Chloroflexi bacterium]|nr:translation initiation factor IF-3 [Chloroflexota bacterium]